MCSCFSSRGSSYDCRDWLTSCPLSYWLMLSTSRRLLTWQWIPFDFVRLSSLILALNCRIYVSSPYCYCYLYSNWGCSSCCWSSLVAAAEGRTKFDRMLYSLEVLGASRELNSGSLLIASLRTELVPPHEGQMPIYLSFSWPNSSWLSLVCDFISWSRCCYDLTSVGGRVHFESTPDCTFSGEGACSSSWTRCLCYMLEQDETLRITGNWRACILQRPFQTYGHSSRFARLAGNCALFEISLSFQFKYCYGRKVHFGMFERIGAEAQS